MSRWLSRFTLLASQLTCSGSIHLPRRTARWSSMTPAMLLEPGTRTGKARYGMGASPHSLMTVFSFHPVKHVAMGEGGAVLCDDPDLLNRLRMLRNHGITRDDPVLDDMAFDENGDLNPWYYEMPRLGYNYRVTDIQAALGISQLERLEESVNRRNHLADYYRRQLEARFPDRTVRPLTLRPGVRHAYHLFVVRIDFEKHGVSRSKVMRRLRDAGSGLRFTTSRFTCNRTTGR